MSRSATLAALLLVTACYSTEPTPALFLPDLAATYHYVAYTSAGHAVLQGTLHFTGLAAIPEDPIPLVGTWAIDWVPGADHQTIVGPQVGSGDFNGVTDLSGVRMAFLPNLVDEYVALTGDPQGSGVSGIWTYGTIAGPTHHGRFTLTLLHSAPATGAIGR